MTPETAVRDRVAGLGTTAGTRVYLLKLPQYPTLPAVRVQRIGQGRPQHLRGPNGLYVTRVQVDTFFANVGDAYAGAEGLAADVRGDGLGPFATGLWGWTGTTGGSPPLFIHNIQLDHDGDPEYESDEFNLVRIRQDYLVHWSELE